MWSVFYMLVEFAQGGLPWRKLKDKVSKCVLNVKAILVTLYFIILLTLPSWL